MASTPLRETVQGFTKAPYLTDSQLDLIVEGIRSGLPREVACRKAGTSGHQFRARCRKDKGLQLRLEEAVAEGQEAYRDLLREIAFFHVFEQRDYKAARDQMMIHLPEWEVLRTQRFEVSAVESEQLKLAAEEAFKDVTTEEIQARIELLKERTQQRLVLLPPAVDGDA